MNKKHWYDYLWIPELLYMLLGFVNILFAWLGMIFFTVPLLFAIIGGNKLYCNRYCGRSQLQDLLGREYKLSPQRPVPTFFRTKLFRYGFLVFFLLMFCNMLLTTYLVFTGGEELRQTVTVLWSLQLPWQWAYNGSVAPWVAQFAFGFYSVMLTSEIIGFAFMLLTKPRGWCVICPMGSMTQLICKLRNR